MFVASGDAGAAGCDTHDQIPPPTQFLSTNAFCSSRYDTCVGGNQVRRLDGPERVLERNSQQYPYESALGYIPEGGWYEPLKDGERGIRRQEEDSVSTSTPPWQTGTGVPGTQGRYTPDIAFSSSLHDGYFACLAAGGVTCVAQQDWQARKRPA